MRIFGPLAAVPGAMDRWFSGNARWLTYPVFVFVVTRLVMLCAVVTAEQILPRVFNVPYWHSGPGRWFLNYWARWDSSFYLGIAESGYYFSPGQQGAVAFFPIYPLLVAILKPLAGSALAAGVLVSNAAFLGALIFLYRLVEEESNSLSQARWATLFIAAFPTAFIFSAIYTESTFLLLSIGTFYFARRRSWAWATLFGLLCSASRIVGVLVWGVVLLEWLNAHGWRLGTALRGSAWAGLWHGVRTDLRSLLTICLIPSGLLSYVLFLQVRFGDPVAFWTTQRAWGREMGAPLDMVSGVFTSWLSVGPAADNISYLDGLNLIALLGGAALTVMIWRRLGESFALYSVLSLLIPASSGFGSMARYGVVVFPLFMMLGIWAQRVWFVRLLLVGFGVMLAVFTAQFVNWVFIA